MMTSPEPPDPTFVPQNWEQVRKHLLHVHQNMAAEDLTDVEAEASHQHEHFGPGGIRNHPFEDISIAERHRAGGMVSRYDDLANKTANQARAIAGIRSELDRLHERAERHQRALTAWRTEAIRGRDTIERLERAAHRHAIELAALAAGNTPAYVFDILRAFERSAPVNFHDHDVPADVQAWCAEHLQGQAPA